MGSRIRGDIELATAKDFFNSIRKSHKELASLQEERERLFTMLTSTTIKPKEINVQTSSGGDKISEVVPQMMELDELIDDQRALIVSKQLQGEKIIRKLPKMEHRVILRWYYIENLKWREVAERMNYSESHVKRLNGAAIKSVEKLIKALDIVLIL